jgi:small subunit ribosomal protein S15
MFLNKAEIINKYKLHNTDTGSAEVQIAILSERISHLTGHLKLNKKDKQTVLSLVKMSSRRQKLLKYLNSVNKHDSVVKLKSEFNLK